MLSNNVIQNMVNSADIFVFMKGTPDEPRCGFSYNTISIIKSLGHPFKSFDILTDEEMRQMVKEYSDWPTYPQVFIKGQLIGGNDIITEMFESGELQNLINELQTH